MDTFSEITHTHTHTHTHTYIYIYIYIYIYRPSSHPLTTTLQCAHTGMDINILVGTQDLVGTHRHGQNQCGH